MQSVVLATVNPAVRLSVCPGIVSKWLNNASYDHPLLLEDNRITLDSSPRTSKGNIRKGGAKWEWGKKKCNFQLISRRITETVQGLKSQGVDGSPITDE